MADAQLALARQYGFPAGALKVTSMTTELSMNGDDEVDALYVRVPAASKRLKKRSKSPGSSTQSVSIRSGEDVRRRCMSRSNTTARRFDSVDAARTFNGDNRLYEHWSTLMLV